MTSARDILILHQWPETSRRRFWIRLKIFLKEGLRYGDWKAVFASRRVGGSVSLPRNVLQGLDELGVRYELNNFSATKSYQNCYVLKDIQCLRWAIEQKRSGRIQHLVAGPMIVNFPFEADHLIEDPLIDTFLLPSLWIHRLFLKLGKRPVRYGIWPIGVDTKKWQADGAREDKKWIVYVKNPEEALLEAVLKALRQKKLEFQILETGNFTQETYRSYLQQAIGVIFLSRTETQGLAMFEAWACNVPTLHWNPGVFRLQQYIFPEASSCPYLTPACGLDFSDANSFPAALEKFQASRKQFSPRTYVEENFTLKKTVENLLRFGNESESNKMKNP